MATITTSQYFDDNPRTAAENWIIQNGAELTIRTDTRWHANAPAGMTGVNGAITVSDGKVIIDATKVRWLAYDTGTGNVPAIGTAITQGATTGYLLGVWADLVSAPTAVGDTMPASGYIKFREVTGTYAVGALTGIGANATGADTAGWIEIVGESPHHITVPRLGEFRTRGDWFMLPQTTDGTVGQVIQTPTNGGGADTSSAGLWIETGVGTNVYEQWPCIKRETDGNWHVSTIGQPYSATDKRCSFVKDIGNGQMQISEAHDMAGTYEELSQSGTYSTLQYTSTYTWEDGKVLVNVATGHMLADGDQAYVDFTTGDAVGSSGVYTIKFLNLFEYEIILAGSGAGGSAITRVGIMITINGHFLGMGDKLHCSFTTGGGVDGEYTIRVINSANVFTINYLPATVISGDVTVWAEYRVHTAGGHRGWAGSQVYLDFLTGLGTSGVYTLTSPRTLLEETGNATYTWASDVVTVTLANHAKSVGDSVELNFTTGGATAHSGVFVVATVTSTSVFTVALAGSGASGAVTYFSASFRINAHNNGLSDSGTLTVKRTIGHTPVAGCKIRISNIILRECASATRNLNTVNANIASRPEFVVSSAGTIDMEYVYSTWYNLLQQAFSIRIVNSAVLDRVYIDRLISPIDIDNIMISTWDGGDCISANIFF
jgi:hypothetical protein